MKTREEEAAYAEGVYDESERAKPLVDALEKISKHKGDIIMGYSESECMAIQDSWSRTADIADEALENYKKGE